MACPQKGLVCHNNDALPGLKRKMLRGQFAERGHVKSPQLPRQTAGVHVGSSDKSTRTLRQSSTQTCFDSTVQIKARAAIKPRRGMGPAVTQLVSVDQTRAHGGRTLQPALGPARPLRWALKISPRSAAELASQRGIVFVFVNSASELKHRRLIISLLP